MKPSSAKAKGRALQKYVCQSILSRFSCLRQDDVGSRSSGANGEDIMLSPAARQILPISIECKNRAKFAVYSDYEQSKQNSGTYEPVLVIKQNKSQPLAVIDLNYFLELMANGSKTKETRN